MTLTDKKHIDIKKSYYTLKITWTTKTFCNAKCLMELAIETVSLPHATTSTGPSLYKNDKQRTKTSIY